VNGLALLRRILRISGGLGYTPAAPWWLYRKSHVINPASGAGTDYQIRITVHYGAGVDNGEHVYLNGKCRADFGDIRFTGSDGETPLFYWMEEKVDGDYAIFWVRVEEDLSTNPVTIYIYYGNPDATTISNGENTFLFFDHFEDLSKWTQVEDSGYITSGVSASEIYAQYDVPQGTGNQRDAYETSTFTLPASFGVKFKFKNIWYTGEIKPQFVILEAHSPRGPHNRYWRTNNANWQYWVDGWYLIGGSAAEDGAYHKAEVLAVNDAWKIYEDGVFVGSWTAITALGLPLGIDFFVYAGYHNAGETRIDWIFVRKYVEPEPSHGAWGPEETAPF